MDHLILSKESLMANDCVVAATHILQERSSICERYKTDDMYKIEPIWEGLQFYPL